MSATRVLKDLTSRARALLKKGDTEAARGLVRDAIALVRDTWGADDVRLVPLLGLMAKSHWLDLADPLDSANELQVSCLERALAIARKQLPAYHLEVGRWAAHLGDSLVVSGRVDEACQLLLEAIDIGRRNSAAREFVSYISLVGTIRLGQGRYGEAIALLEEAAVYERDSTPFTHALAVYSLGRALAAGGRHSEAISKFEMAGRAAHAHASDMAQAWGALAWEVAREIAQSRAVLAAEPSSGAVNSKQ